MRAMVGRLGLPAAALQPRDPGPAPAGLGVQAVHPGRRARGRHLARPHVRVGAEDARGAAGRRSRSKNYEDRYAGVTTLARRDHDRPTTPSTPRSATSSSAPRAVARVARRMGVRTPISRNPAMVLGGLKEGVTPLEMAKSYETLAQRRRAGDRARSRRYEGGPVTFTKVEGPGVDDKNDVKTQARRSRRRRRAGDRDPPVRRHERHRARGAAIGEFAAGKTGTTENYQDAWFVGFNDTAHRRGLGRLPGGREADGDRVPRRARRGRHVPGRDLARLHAVVRKIARRARQRAERQDQTDGCRRAAARRCRRDTQQSDGGSGKTQAQADHADQPRTGGGTGGGQSPRSRHRPSPRRRPTPTPDPTGGGGTGGGTGGARRRRSER